MPLTPGRFVGQTLDLRATSSQRSRPRATVSGIGGTGFSPLHLRGLALWLDASDTSTITESSGAVSQWNDKSGYGRHVSQATSANQPTTNSTSQNGLNTLSFDGGGDKMSTAAAWGTFNGPTPRTALIVAKAGTTGYRWILAFGSESNTGRIYMVGTPSSNTNAYVAWSGDHDSGYAMGTTSHRIIVSRLAGLRSSQIWLDGGAPSNFTTSVDVNTTSTGPLWVSRQYQNDAEWWKGEIAEIILCSETLTIGEINLIGRWLADKWGLTWTPAR